MDKVTSTGNAAGTGARIALLNSAARREIEHIVRTIEKVETAIEPKFQEHFVAANKLPHDTQPYTKLRQIAEWPDFDEGPTVSEDGTRRRRRRRS